MGGNDGRRVKAVDTSCSILSVLREKNGCSIATLSEILDLSGGAVHTHLATLKDHGLVVQDGTEYQLGPQLVPMGQAVKHNSQLYQAAKQEVDQLAEETGECVHIVSEHGGRCIILYEEFGNSAVGTKYHTRSRESPSNYLHNRAAGKAILAYLPAERVNQIVEEHGLPSATEDTITNRDELFDELSAIRSEGYATNDEEEIRGLRAVGAPILDNDGNPLGGISISAPSSRLQGDTFTGKYPDLITETVNIIEVNHQTEEFSIC
jgi:DNA-binding IclR family transcriptional regulator